MTTPITFTLTAWKSKQQAQHQEVARLHSPILFAETGAWFLPTTSEAVFKKRLALVEFLDHRVGKPFPLIWIHRGGFEDPFMAGQDMPYLYPSTNLSEVLRIRLDQAAQAFNTPHGWLPAALQARFPEALLSMKWEGEETKSGLLEVSITHNDGRTIDRQLTNDDLNTQDLQNIVEEIAITP